MVALWGRPQIDLFASRNNYKIKPYYSWKPDPGAEVVDAFSVSWGMKYVYAFPPFGQVGKVLRKIENEGAKAFVVLPLWTTQHWFPKVAHMLTDYPSMLHCRPGELLLSHPTKSVKELPRMKLIAVLVSGDDKLVHSFQETLSWQPRGEILQSDSIRFTFASGSCFVVHGVQIPMRRMK